MHCVSRDTYSVCKNEVMEHRGSCHCCRMCPNCYYYCNYVTIIAIIVSIIRIIPQPKVAFRVGIHCRLQANRIIQQRRRLNYRPPRRLLPQQGPPRPHHPPLGTHDGCRKATRHAWQDETDRPGYQRIGQSTSSCPATRGLQVQDLDEPANNAYN